MRSRLIIFLLFVAAFRPRASADLKSELQQNYKGKQLLLKVPYSGTSLRFDSDGNLVGSSQIGPWTTSGVLLVKEVRVESKSIEIDGVRELVISFSPSPEERIATIPTGAKVHITLDLQDPVRQAEDTIPLLARVFQGGDLQQQIANFWRPSPEWEKNPDKLSKHLPGTVVGLLNGVVKVYSVGSEVLPPKPIHTPYPDYPAALRSHGNSDLVILCIVINEMGAPVFFAAAKSPSEALAEHAALAVAKWKFEPARREGQPVPVVINVEINFRTQ